jgi:hypothetical protein
VGYSYDNSAIASIVLDFFGDLPKYDGSQKGHFVSSKVMAMANAASIGLNVTGYI